MLRTSIVGAAVALVTFGCGEGASPTAPSGSPGSSGTLNVRITDSPYGSAQAVLVTFSEVTAHRSDGDGTRVPFADPNATTWTCDLKKLQNGAQDILATGRPNPGQFTMVRLVVQSATIYFDRPSVSSTPCARSIPAPEGASFPLTIPNGEVRLNGSFTVGSEAATTVLLDFDGEASISQTGPAAYRMNPVVRVVSVQ
jgi:hypothetical protein